MSKKKESKKKNAKKERYAKFRKDKNVKTAYSSPELTPEQYRQQREDDDKINSFLRYSKNKPVLSLREKKRAKNRR
jgi:hypothetical protein